MVLFMLITHSDAEKFRKILGCFELCSYLCGQNLKQL